MKEHLKKTLQRLFVLLMAVIIFAEVLTPAGTKRVEAAGAERWGVFIGTHVRSLDKIKGYKYVVIDAQNYTKAEISRLKTSGCKIYSYLSIGTIETYRSYYKKFKKYGLRKYNNWNSERWVDVRKKRWQKYVVNTLVPRIMGKGVDGLWVDNTDVYYQYHKKKFFNALVSMLRKIHNKGIPIIINGGDVFVSKLIKKKKHYIIDGIMQEEVLTLISNYDKGKFKKQTKADFNYFNSYIKRCRANGIKVTLLEYTKKASMRKKIVNFCKKNGYGYYISNNVKLK